jgi:periplasmic copper chaperone A
MNRRKIVMSLVFTPSLAWGHSYAQGDIAIGHAWALPTTLSEAQVFMPLLNRGKATDALVAARSSVCRLIELRRNNRYDDPPEVEFLLEPGKPLPMRPASRHLRLIGLAQPLVEGAAFETVLDFRDAGEIAIHVEVSPHG